jgi:hypothetical protein
MYVTTQITLDSGESFDQSPEEAASAILKSVGGDEATDFSTVNIAFYQSGDAGTPPKPPTAE